MLVVKMFYNKIEKDINIIYLIKNINSNTI